MRKGLLISTMLVSVAGLEASVEAANQCLQTPSCESLGYTQTSCVDNNGVKCPFGNKYFCVCPVKYAYSCSGTGYAGGKGTACNGKYDECTCINGYEWNNACKKITCKIGDIFYSDKTCSSDVISGKTPIAVVIYAYAKGGGQAIALKPIGSYAWGDSSKDITSLKNYDSSFSTLKDFASCENTRSIIAAGDKGTYPAAWAAHEYSTEGTKAGDWCLPAAGIWFSYYNAKETINSSLERVGGTKGASNGTCSWTSTESNNNEAWVSGYLSTDMYAGLYDVYKGNSYEVRPVIEF